MIKETILMMTKNMSSEDIVKMIKNEAEQFIKTNGNNDKQLSFACTMFLTKELLVNNTINADDLLKEWNERENLSKIFKN